jgi:ribosomal-protein-alanine N-acetyltransferase
MTIIVSKRVQLKSARVTREAINQQVRWLNNKDVVRFSEQRHQTHTFDSQLTYLSSFLNAPHKIYEIHCAGDMIGTITAYIDINNSVADLGILIGETSSWGKGLGTEAWKLLCDMLLVTGIRKIEAGMMGCNYGMISICKKTEMHLDGFRDDHFMIGNELSDLVQYARFNE